MSTAPNLNNLRDKFLSPGLEQAPVAITIISGKDHIVQEANPKQLDVWMKTADETINRSIFDIFPELRHQGFEDLLEGVYETGKTISVQEREAILNRHGKLQSAWFDITYSPVRNEDGALESIMVISQEVTDKMLARQALEQNQQKYQSLFNNMHQGFCIIEMIFNDNNEPIDYIFEECNSVFSLQSGLPSPEGKRAKELVPDLEQKWFERYGSVAQTGDPVTFIEESPAMGKWFEVYAYKLEPKTDGRKIAVIFKDITERKHHELKLKQSEEKFREQLEELESIYHTAPIGLALFDREYRFLRVNRLLAEINGIAPEDHIGKSLFDIVPDLSDAVVDMFDQIFETGEAMLNIELSGETRAKPGVIRTWNESWYPIKNSNGQTVAVSAVVEEITQLKEIQQQIRQSETRFRTLAENLPDVVSRHDKNFRYLYANRAIRKYIDRDPSELIGMNFRELGLPEHVCKFFESHIADVFDTKQMKLIEFRNPIGPEFLFARLVPEFDDYGDLQTVLILNTDITKLHEAEQALKESESRFRELANDTPAFMFTADGETNIDFVNRQWLDFVGYRNDEGLGKAWARVTHPDDVGPMMEIYTDAVRNKKPYQFQIRQKNTKGEYRWIIWNGMPRLDIDGEFKGMIGTGMDITEQQKIEEIVRESEVRFRTIADLVPQIVWTARPDGVTDYFNNRWIEFTGQKTIAEFNIMELLHPDEIQMLSQAWSDSLNNGAPYNVELRLWDQQHQQYRWMQSRAIPLRDADGKIIKWFGTTTDIHDQKNLQEKLEKLVTKRTRELENSNDQLHRSNEDLQQFAHVASHDLKEPVRKVITFLLRLREELGSNCSAKSLNYIDRIELSARRMSNMIDGILLYSSVRGTVVDKESVALKDMLAQIETDLELLFLKKSASLQVVGDAIIEGSQVLLYQLFYNLLSNALKFCRKDVFPRIIISSEPLADNERISMNLSTHQKWLKIAVHDNGIGFPQGQSDNIFQTFTRLHSKDQFEGTGLGLSLCKKIVERHGGKILAESQEGKGSTFTVFLPGACTE